MQRLLLGLLLLSMTTACSKANFASDDSLSANGLDGGDGTVNVVCNEILRNSTIPIKIIVSVDTSGSNKPHSKNGQMLAGSDTDKSRRGGAMQSFLNQYSSKDNFSWSLLHFQDDFSDSLTLDYFGNSAKMQAGIQSFYQVNDENGTPYMAALNLIQQNIAMDPNPTNDTKYIVIFVSDGKPDPEVSTSTLTNKVNTIKNLAANRVSFSTIFYGADDSEATTRLQAMATAGGGSFLNASQSTNLRIQDVVSVPGTNCN